MKASARMARTFTEGHEGKVLVERNRRSLAFDGGLTLAYADADRTCCLTFTDDAMSGGRTSRYVKLDAPCRRLRVVGDASSLEIFLNDGAAVLSTRYYPAGAPTLRAANLDAVVYPLNL